MPHVIVKPRLGKSEQPKARLAGSFTEAMSGVLSCGEASVSVAIDERRAIKTPLRPWCNSEENDR